MIDLILRDKVYIYKNMPIRVIGEESGKVKVVFFDSVEALLDPIAMLEFKLPPMKIGMSREERNTMYSSLFTAIYTEGAPLPVVWQVGMERRRDGFIIGRRLYDIKVFELIKQWVSYGKYCTPEELIQSMSKVPETSVLEKTVIAQDHNLRILQNYIRKGNPAYQLDIPELPLEEYCEQERGLILMREETFEREKNYIKRLERVVIVNEEEISRIFDVKLISSSNF